jgi:large subunit ribosomal protein L32
MAVPKRRHSHTRGAKRRTHWTLKRQGLSTCSHCSQPKLPHRICQNCGYYGGVEVVTPKEA